MKSIILILNFLFCTTLCFGQKIPNGTYLNVDSNGTTILSKTRVEINENSIEIWVKYSSKSSENKNLFFSGTYKCIKDKFFADMTLMKCDTCPVKKWKKAVKKSNTAELVYSGKTDTIISKGDTSYYQPAIFSSKSPISLDRQHFAILTINDYNSILLYDRVFIRQEKKDYQ